MDTQYWVGDFFIDLTRNQITQETQSQTIPPKALAVLTYLAKNANQVVSHDELLAEVWPDTIVTPNTLQRSIAQLRKAFRENSQYQSYIKTHAKQGYSLEVEVRWHDNSGTKSTKTQGSLEKNDNIKEGDVGQSEIDNIKPTKKSWPALSFISIFAAIIISFFVVTHFTSKPPFELSFTELRSLTATDNKEFSGIYSPNGQYIVFHRYSEKRCMMSNIWAKNIKTQEEVQLTKKMGIYGSHRFSQDGKELIFIETEDCEQPITQKQCYRLLSLNFEKALRNSQSPTLLLECKNSKIQNPVWLNNGQVALMQQHSNRWELTSYSPTKNQSSVIYSLEDGSIIDYDYSAIDELIALTSVHSDGQYYIEILKPDGQVLSSHQIEFPKEIPNLRFIYPNFTPIDQHLIFSTGRQLFTLSYEGKIANISLPLDEPMSSPIFHPDGKRMLMIKGVWDSDIATLTLPKTIESPLIQSSAEEALTDVTNHGSILDSSTLVPSVLVPSILERSTLAEDNALYQPNGKLIAFKSDRSGDDQIWTTDGNGSRQLTNFPIDTYINGLNWAADGQSILVNVNNMLTQVNLDSSQKHFPLGHRVEQLFQWNSEEHNALLTTRVKGVIKFGEFNLNNLEFTVFTNKKVNWALKSEDGRLIYTDHMDRFWQPGPVEDQLIEPLYNQGSEHRFVIKDNVIYGVNEEFQLWSYDLKQETFNILGSVPENIDYLTDVSQTELLVSIRIIAKKELAELILAN